MSNEGKTACSHPETVMDFDTFVQKYGTKGPSLIISRFIELAPAFPQEIELARVIGEMISDLEFASQMHLQQK